MDEKQRHPSGLIPLFFTEMWERFGYYLMLGILPLYLSDKEKGGIGWSDAEAAVVVGSYIALVYLTPFVGGLLADRLLGFRKTIVIGAILMMIGYFLLAIPTVGGMYLALGVVILGNGAFKPNISTLLGRLYPAGSPLKDAGYNIFYMGINIGAFLCNFAAAFVRNYVDAHPQWGIKGWNAAFCSAGVGMLCGLLIFLCNYRRFAANDLDTSKQQGPRESLNPLWFECLIPAAVMASLSWMIAKSIDSPFSPPTAAFLGACIPVIVFFLRVWRSQSDPDERRRVAALLVVYVVIVVFFMSFHLNTTALNFWARDDTHREPNAAVRVITDQFEEFAENAPPKYFNNAGNQVPRPAKSSFILVDETRYKELSEQNKLWDFRDNPAGGQKKVHVYVTQEILDKIYARVGPDTRVLPEGQPLKLVNTELFQSINPMFVVLFTPLVVGFFALLRHKGLEPTTPAKIGLGLLINAGAPLMMYFATGASDNSAHKVSAWWLCSTYAITTVGELCLSPMGLSLVSKVSPPKITAFMMGGFFLAISIGNKLSGIFGEAYTTMDHYTFWMFLAACNLAFGLFVFVILDWLKRQMGSALH